MQISMVIPAYNEQKRIGPTLADITDYLNEQYQTWEIIVCDDGSSDTTAATVEAVAKTTPHVHLHRLAQNCGKGRAVQEGMSLARGERVLFSDADLATPIEELALLENTLDAGADVAIASRALKKPGQVKKDAWHRSLMGKVFNLFVRIFAVRGFHDTQCGFKLFTRESQQEIFPHLSLRRFAFDVEILLIARRLGFAIREIPVNWIAQPGSKVNIVKDTLVMFLSLWHIFFKKTSGQYPRKKQSTG